VRGYAKGLALTLMLLALAPLIVAAVWVMIGCVAVMCLAGGERA